MQKNSKCSLCGHRDETTNHIINDCCKLAKKSIRLDMTGDPLGIVQEIET